MVNTEFKRLQSKANRSVKLKNKRRISKTPNSAIRIWIDQGISQYIPMCENCTPSTRTTSNMMALNSKLLKSASQTNSLHPNNRLNSKLRKKKKKKTSHHNAKQYHNEAISQYKWFTISPLSNNPHISGVLLNIPVMCKWNMKLIHQQFISLFSRWVICSKEKKKSYG